MGIIDQVGSELLQAENVRPFKSSAVASQEFDLDFATLKNGGFYYGGANRRQLSLQLRAIKRRLLRRIGFLRASRERQSLGRRDRQRNVILMTSTRSGEGKTFNAANLALSFAVEDQIETLAIDCDLIRPQLRKAIGAPKGVGLSDLILKDDVSFQDVAWKASQAPLSVIGPGTPVRKTTDVLGGESAQSLWTQLSRENSQRLVILDAPPVLAATDAVVLARFVDEIVFVVEANKTPEPAAAAAIDEILEVNPNVSIILNKCLIASGGSHYGSYEYYDAMKERAES